MLELPLDVWAMMLFSIVVFFGISTWALVYSIAQEERKMKILSEEGALDSFSPRALRDLKAWLDAHPDADAPAVRKGRDAYAECVEALQTTDRHVYDWSDADITRLDSL
jgi:hypothetical protein